MKCTTHGNESCPNLRCREHADDADPLRGAFWPIKKVSREHPAELYPSDLPVGCNYNFPLMTRLEYGQPGRVPTDHAWALMLSEDLQPEPKRVEDEYPGDEAVVIGSEAWLRSVGEPYTGGSWTGDRFLCRTGPGDKR